MFIVTNKEMKFKNKIVLITGGGSGIGLATAQEFLLEGAFVFLVCRTKKNNNKIIKKLNIFKKSYQILLGDMSKKNDVDKVFRNIKKYFNKLDILVNSAGLSQNRKYNQISLNDWYLTFDNNVTNTFLVSVKAIEIMKKKKYGKIINVSSVAARNRSKLAGLHYSLSKSAIITMTRQLAAEVAPYGINVNCVAPSQTNTEMLKPFLTKKNRELLKNIIPIGRVAEAEEQAKVILFLASEDSKYMVGSIVDVNGGQI